MGSLQEDLTRIEKKLDLLLSFFSVSADRSQTPQNVIDLSLKARKSAQLRRIKENERASKR
jgi:hypothetical protein